ncbi:MULTISPECIES: hypothetical protein [Haloferax]|jgi:hypothetical protein|uniref:VanZ family protein n=2 Tax=Haloferax TaxID=2251 RepID=A0A6C0UWU8_HALVO|nr:MULTISPECIES: hypothetical protein [Haloferax]ELZ55285.1 hypothetical protein C460_16507 [Haloferax sp. ATCC BAA-646]ELZ66542.1 hypothetical protein C459_03905 [Haloferax sp. ATCC BAA-645]ELZ66731.1 hypothetical protein C458_11820 [Haloferax sp. ATCC BAA-644]MBC9987269.1 hypothetical protein [Haloferax sp. AS1]NLV04199.1 hypothetical protein [Haloferax alexandrinus]
MLRRTLNETVLAGWEERPREMAAVAVFGSVVTVTHFTSMALFLYTRIWWWDILVHAASGFGVAAILYVLNPRLLHSRLALLVVLPMAVAAIGTWFEVYERLFTGFWVEWPRSVYLEDTAVDIVADTAGAVVFGVVRPLWNRIRRWRDPNRL